MTLFSKKTKNLASGFLVSSLLAFTPFLHSAESPRPIEKAAAALILMQSGYVLPARQQCGDGGDLSVRDFLAEGLFLISEGPPSQSSTIAIQCNQLSYTEDLKSYYSAEVYPETAARQLGQLREGTVLHQCTLTFGSAHDESVWNRSIQALVDAKGERLIEGTVRCLMTP